LITIVAQIIDHETMEANKDVAFSDDMGIVGSPALGFKKLIGNRRDIVVVSRVQEYSTHVCLYRQT
jgi:hypothetical protein